MLKKILNILFFLLLVFLIIYLINPLLNDFERKTFDYRLRISKDKYPLEYKGSYNKKLTSNKQNYPLKELLSFHTLEARSDIVIVAIDGDTENIISNDEDFNIGRWPWPRYILGNIINFISQGNPKAIVLDIRFAGTEGNLEEQIRSDHTFAAAIKNSGSVYVGTAMSNTADENTYMYLDSLQHIQDLHFLLENISDNALKEKFKKSAIDMFLESSGIVQKLAFPITTYQKLLHKREISSAQNITPTPFHVYKNAKGVGSINLPKDEDEIARSNKPVWNISGTEKYMLSLPLKVAYDILPPEEQNIELTPEYIRLGSRMIPTDKNNNVILNWHGNGGSHAQTYDYIPAIYPLLSEENFINKENGLKIYDHKDHSSLFHDSTHALVKKSLQYFHTKDLTRYLVDTEGRIHTAIFNGQTSDDKKNSLIRYHRPLGQTYFSLIENIILFPQKRETVFAEYYFDMVHQAILTTTCNIQGYTDCNKTNSGKRTTIGLIKDYYKFQDHHFIFHSFMNKEGTIENLLAFFPPYEKTSNFIRYNQFRQLSPEYFTGKIVLLGQTSPGTDFHSTPMEPIYPGVEIVATAIDNYLNDGFNQSWSRKFIHNVPLWITICITLLCITLASTTIKHIQNNFLAVTCTFGTIMTYIIFACYIFVTPHIRLNINIVHPILAIIFTSVYFLHRKVSQENEERKKLENLFGKVMSEQVFKSLLNVKDINALYEQGTRQELTVLFVDIRNFTSISESISPEELVDQINEYFDDMVKIIKFKGGTLDKYIGDAIMAIYGAPYHLQDHASRAVDSALLMVNKLKELNAKWQSQGKHVLKIGFGINSGDMVCGWMGAKEVKNYSVIGDNVNLASRIENLNKIYGTTILIGENTYQYVKDLYQVEFVETTPIKGKQLTVNVYAVTGYINQPEKII